MYVAANYTRSNHSYGGRSDPANNSWYLDVGEIGMSPEVEALQDICHYQCPPSKQLACTKCDVGKKIDELEDKEKKNNE